MISVYTGTPGSGKSYHVAKQIEMYLKTKRNVIANFPIDTNQIKRCKGTFIYMDDGEITVDFLYNYAKQNHKIGKEGQTILVIDEAQRLFNCRDFARKDRMQWITFYSQHRKYGFNVILVTQNDQTLDKQIRALIEYEYRHRKVNNYGLGGLILSLTFTIWFVSIEYWYGMKGKDARLGATFIPLRKKILNIYNSYKLFEG